MFSNKIYAPLAVIISSSVILGMNFLDGKWLMVAVSSVGILAGIVMLREITKK